MDKSIKYIIKRELSISKQFASAWTPIAQCVAGYFRSIEDHFSTLGVAADIQTVFLTFASQNFMDACKSYA